MSRAYLIKKLGAEFINKPTNFDELRKENKITETDMKLLQEIQLTSSTILPKTGEEYIDFLLDITKDFDLNKKTIAENFDIFINKTSTHPELNSLKNNIKTILNNKPVNKTLVVEE